MMSAAAKAYLLVRSGNGTGELSPPLSGRLADLIRKFPDETDELLSIAKSAWDEGSAHGYGDGKEAGYEEGLDAGEAYGRQDAAEKAEAALKDMFDETLKRVKDRVTGK